MELFDALILLLIMSLGYFTGVLISSYTKIEHEQTKKIRKAFMAISSSIAFSFAIFVYTSDLFAIIAGIIIFLWQVFIIREKDSYLLNLVIVGLTILSLNANALMLIALTMILQGTQDYITKQKNKNLKKTFLIDRSVVGLLIPVIMLIIINVSL